MAGGEVKAWPLDELKKQPVVNDKFDGVPIVLVYDPSTGTAWTFDRRIASDAAEKTLTFNIRDDGLVIDRGTESLWHFAKGFAVSGPLKGTRLEPVPSILSDRRAGTTFHPHTHYRRAAR